MGARYCRALTGAKCLAALTPGGTLDFLLSGLPCWNDDPYAFDIQVREKNKIMYYHGTTRLLVLQIREKAGAALVKASADARYGKYPGSKAAYEKLMRTWDSTEASALAEAFEAYLLAAAQASAPRYYGKDDASKRQHEGYWQNRLCVRFGRCCREEDKWLIVDREGVVGFENGKVKEAFYRPIMARYERIRDDLQRHDSIHWGVSNERKAREGKRETHLGDELDILALTREGELLAIELKHGRNAKGVYWGPLQVCAYRDAFREKLPKISKEIAELVKQKVDLGLLPRHALERLPADEFRYITPVLAIAEPLAKSGCWKNLHVVDKMVNERIQVVEVGVESNGDLVVTPGKRHIWRDGRVDLCNDFILLTHGKTDEGDRITAVAMVALGDESDPRFVVEMVTGLTDEKKQEVESELQFYLCEHGGPDPWAYAIHHCSTAANIYSSVHWGYYPAGYQTESLPRMSAGMERRLAKANRLVTSR